MNERQKYINDLSIYLRQLTDEERNDALEFYDEYIADAGLETRTAIEERLGTPRQLSHKILDDYSIKANNESIKEGHPASPHSSWRVFWWVLVAIITSPITFGLGIAVLALLLAAGGVALSLIVGIVALIFGVAVIAIVSLYIGIGLLATNLFSGLFYLGLGVTLIGLFLVCLPLIYWLIRVIVQGIANFAKFIYAKVQARRKK
ncbi:DUF1700 domain-containing protein [Limosilactobacillus reuteri]|uniref:DUF1700 domain-containing protein n=1 Tax=Limosilactobacillus reuteri TaxID=1598 RepID=UPI001E5431A5|nr:DUF1700 domain-containing protein [Limosilactobacillus reuteri]MCC4331441.1 DUF1700 domain-containing protein [Limosilactobacillus reuteri]MCC4353439.1 DUF1700 domain-containing protein [Limosilactobacillus reuteri]